MNVFIIIPVFNRKEFTRDCLNSLREQTHSEFSTIVVDDGSTDGTDRMLAEEYPKVTVLKGDGNLWWTGGVNKGIEFALSKGANYCMTLNNDTIVPENFVEKMCDAARLFPDSVIGGLEKDVKTREITYGGEVYDERKTVHLLNVLSKEKQRGLHEVSCLPGRGLLIPKSVFEKIGLFDFDNFPHYLADFDFTYNAMKSGFSLYINYDAELYTYPEESGDAENKAHKSLSGYYNHLFTRRGGANLKDFTRYTLKNSPPKFLAIRLLEGYLRRIIGYWV